MMNSRFLKSYKIILIFILKVEVICIYAHSKILKIDFRGPIEGEIFSAMPTGMETTVRIKVLNYLLTGVVFGGVLYKIGQKVRLSFAGEGIVLFSRVNGRLVSCGKLEVTTA